MADDEGSALQDFNEGYTDAQQGKDAEKGRSIHYRNAYAAATARQKEKAR